MSQVIEMTGGGRIRLWEEGSRVCFRCERPLCKDGIYKVWVRGDGGEMLLGTLMPEGSTLQLCRAVNREELRRCGCWPVRSVRCAMTYSFRQQKSTSDGWYWEENPARFVDRETRELGEWCGMLCRKVGDCTELACPVNGESPIALVHLFCLADLRYLRGKMCLVWCFGPDGAPMFPSKK